MELGQLQYAWKKKVRHAGVDQVNSVTMGNLHGKTELCQHGLQTVMGKGPVRGTGQENRDLKCIEEGEPEWRVFSEMQCARNAD